MPPLMHSCTFNTIKIPTKKDKQLLEIIVTLPAVEWNSTSATHCPIKCPAKK